ncbi:MAG: di-trans,poly-cis-decaprenylcistransferase [Clostridiales bacterium]|nr:di-trans,poly-cis-decaprenylcistransferase [Clostridiales bacterium]
MSLWRKRKSAPRDLDLKSLPRHIAIIMDGNGRWAQQRGLPRTAGHSRGAENFRTVATHCKEIGIEYLTVYAFSTENWSRPPKEVETIMGLLEKYLYEAIERMERDKVKMKFFGDVSVLPKKLRELIERTELISEKYDGCQVNICLNYGGRDDIIRGAQSYAEDFAAGNINSLTDGEFSARLYSGGLPDPELIIRSGGEKRLSNFLLWQGAYSELYFTDILWPDFGKDEINAAILWYQGRNRRFGGV